MINFYKSVIDRGIDRRGIGRDFFLECIGRLHPTAGAASLLQRIYMLLGCPEHAPR